MIFRVYFQNGSFVDIEADNFCRSTNVDVNENDIAFFLDGNEIAWVHPSSISAIIKVPEGKK